MSATPSRQHVLGLFRSLLRQAGRLEDYNFRDYAKRRVTLGFQEGRSSSGEEAVREYKDGVKNLEMLKRQVLISHLYPSKRSVMELDVKAPTLG
jgi:hypothetical protein